MNSIFNYVADGLSQTPEEGTLISGKTGSSIELRVTSVASDQIEALVSMTSESIARVSLSLENLPCQLIQEIVTYFTLQDCGRFSLVTTGIHALLNSEGFTKEICPILYRGFEKLYPNVINLDRLGAGPKLGLPEYKEPESIESLKAHMDVLREAGLLAELSEDGKAVSVTIQKDWSIEKAEAMSRAAVDAGIASARIEYLDPSYRTVLQSSPTEKEQKVAISNTVLIGSCKKTIERQKALLKANGLEEEFPDALTVLTVAVLRRILSGGEEASYARYFTYTNKKTPEGWTLCVTSALSCVSVSGGSYFVHNAIGVGGLRKFKALGP